MYDRQKLEKDITSRPRSEQRKIAKQFSEGSRSYEKLLLLLWKHRIETKAGCSGIPSMHADVDDCRAYVSMAVTPENRAFLDAFVEQLVCADFTGEYRISCATEEAEEKSRQVSCTEIPKNATSLALYSYKFNCKALYTPRAKRECNRFFKMILRALKYTIREITVPAMSR